MSRIILDFGSGNTCKNSKPYIKKMYDKLKEIDNNKHEIIVKWQLFEKAGNNIPLSKQSFDYAYHYGKDLGYQVTSSIFDRHSLDFLMTYEVPFIKIANNRRLDHLIKYIPEEIMLYISSDLPLYIDRRKETYKHLWCISKYPALFEEYERFKLSQGCYLSDHTICFGLFYKYNPNIIEWHYKLENSKGLDAGEFARTPKQLMDVL
jgi:sialic acid synthase SpsE